MENSKNEIMMLIAVVDKNSGERVLSVCRQHGFERGVILDGRGTADKNILKMLGIERIERDIAVCLVPRESAQELLLLCNEEIEFYTPGNGIAFTAPLSSIDPDILLKHFI